MSMQLAISFTDQSPNFVNGVEFGRILAKAEQGAEALSNAGFPVHMANIEDLKKLCAAYGYVPTFGKEMHGWIDFLGVKQIASEN